MRDEIFTESEELKLRELYNIWDDEKEKKAQQLRDAHPESKKICAAECKTYRIFIWGGMFIITLLTVGLKYGPVIFRLISNLGVA